MSAWGKIHKNTTAAFSDIMSEEYAQRLHREELKRCEKSLAEREKLEEEEALVAVAKVIQDIQDDIPTCSAAVGTLIATTTTPTNNDVWQDHAVLLAARVIDEEEEEEEILIIKDEINAALALETDEAIARTLQAQFDHEYNEQIDRVERKRNGKSKVSISLNNFRRYGEAYDFDDNDNVGESEEDDEQRRDWDRFETNEKILADIPRCGYKVDKEGDMITKHDQNLCGVRNACRVMSFPPGFQTGDGAGFDMKLSNRVFNQLKTYSRRGRTKKNKQQDRKVDVATAEMGMDARTRLLLYKLINNQVLEQINGIISTGKEAVILHANSDPNYSPDERPNDKKDHEKKILSEVTVERVSILPKECAIKIFKTTLNEFKQRDRYIKDDYRFKERFSKQNNRVIINMWAEKEMYNMMRMQMAGINCPDVVMLKQHVLVMSFIGNNHNAAPKLKDASLSAAEWECAYTEVVETMHKMYNEAKLVHADLSEYNILWHDNKCWFIDVAQSVEPEHPSALEFLMRDCNNIVTFFAKRHLGEIYTKEELFEHITSLNAETHNVAMLERIHTRGASIGQATAPNKDDCPDELKPLDFPFDLAWEKTNSDKYCMQKCNLQSDNITTKTIAAPLIVVTDGHVGTN